MLVEEKIYKKYLFGLLVVEQFRYTKTYLLFNAVPILQVTKYPKVEAFDAKN
ncbi:hypothetical protein IJ818_07880 [bacterium]|nr:hypothetical protein [bacterium]